VRLLNEWAAAGTAAAGVALRQRHLPWEINTAAAAMGDPEARVFTAIHLSNALVAGTATALGTAPIIFYIDYHVHPKNSRRVRLLECKG
jgi:hypothetical protein